MTKEERCQLAIEKGFTYNPETGKIYSRYNKELKAKSDTGYIRLTFKENNKTYVLNAHQFGWYFVNKECANEIDHINNIRDDNRISNLRSVSRQENMWNRKSTKGYSWNKLLNKWQSFICVNGKNKRLGTFETEEDARIAYLTAKNNLHKFNN